MVKVETKSVENQEAILNVEVEAARVEKSLQAAYRRIVQQVAVPGFRRGKAPMHIVERIVGSQRLYTEALRELLPEVIPAAIQEAGVQAADVPEYDVEQLERGKPLVLRLTVPLQPRVELGDYRSISVPSTPAEISEEQVQSALQRVREQAMTRTAVHGRPARHGDIITADVRIERDGRVVDSREDLQIEIGRNAFPAGFDQQVEGMLIGEVRSFELALRTSEAPAEGAPAEPPQMYRFTVRLKAIEEQHVPELTDEFVRSLGLGLNTVEELREELRRRLAREAELAARYALEERAVALAVERSVVEIPRTLIERQAEALARDRRQRLEEQGIPLARYLAAIGRTEAEWRRELVAEAEQMLRRSLVLDKIAEAEQLQVSDEEVDAEIEQAASSRQDPAEQARVRTALNRAEARERIRENLRTRKTVQFLATLAAENAARGVPPTPLAGEREREADTGQASGAGGAGEGGPVSG
jgi:trigger factor